jgi:hypothetical protein
MILEHGAENRVGRGVVRCSTPASGCSRPAALCRAPARASTRGADAPLHAPQILRLASTRLYVQLEPACRTQETSIRHPTSLIIEATIVSL